MIRKVIAIITFIFLVFLIAVLIPCDLSYAHSGRTDDEGGLYDSETGEYHYHHGYPAHQHPNGECIYDFDDNTSHSSNANIILDSDSIGIKSSSNRSLSDGEQFGIIVGGLFGFIVLVGVVENIVEKKEKKKKSNS